jgi:ribosomal protein S9
MTDEEIIFVKANFRSGMPIKVKIVQFGPLGASVSINDGIARGLVLQREIAMLRDKRNGEDVVLGDELGGAYYVHVAYVM